MRPRISTRCLSALAVEGRALDPLRLLAFAEFLDSLALTCAAIRRVSGAFPTLKALAENCGSFKNQIGEVRSKIDPSGEVNDNASPELSRLRTQLRKQRARLRSTLESYLRGKDTSRYLQDQVVSDRDGRYVLVVKAEHRDVDSRHHPRQLRQRREPLSRTAEHRRDQQRDRGARAAGARRGAPHPAAAHRCVPR